MTTGLLFQWRGVEWTATLHFRVRPTEKSIKLLMESVDRMLNGSATQLHRETPNCRPLQELVRDTVDGPVLAIVICMPRNQPMCACNIHEEPANPIKHTATPANPTEHAAVLVQFATAARKV